MLYEKAVAFVAERCGGRVRADGSAYMDRVAHVVDTVKRLCSDAGMREEEADVHAAAAALHSILDDTEVSVGELRSTFGGRVALAVDYMTRRKGERRAGPLDEPYLDFILRCRKNRIARRVKLAAVQCSLEDLEKTSLRDRYALALRVLRGEVPVTDLL